MQPLADASVADRTRTGVTLAFAEGWECRVLVLADDLFRVLLVRNGALLEPRTWQVAPYGHDVPWEGRDRNDLSPFPQPDFALTEGPAELTLATRALSVRVGLDPFRLEWSVGGMPVAADRPTDPCSTVVPDRQVR